MWADSIGKFVGGIIRFPYRLYLDCDAAAMYEQAAPEELENHDFGFRTKFMTYLALYFATFMGIVMSMTLLNYAYHPKFIENTFHFSTVKQVGFLKDILVPMLNPDGSLDKTNITVIWLTASFICALLFAFLVGKTTTKIAWVITKILCARLYVEYLFISLVVGLPFLYFEKVTFIKLFPVIGLSAFVCSYLRPIEMVRDLLYGCDTTRVGRMGNTLGAKYRSLKANKPQQQNVPQNVQTGPFQLHLGVSTGEFLKKEHVRAMSPSQKVTLEFKDCCTNFLIFGGIGAGKTTCVINSLLVQLFRQDAGGLIFDVKSDFKNEVHYFASEEYQNPPREIVTIGAGNHRPINLLKGLTPEMAGTFLKSAFILESGSVGRDAYWIDNAVNMCVGALGVLLYIGLYEDKAAQDEPGAYSLSALYRYVFVPEERKKYTDKANKLVNKFREHHLTNEYESLIAFRNRYNTHFADLDPKTKGCIESTVSTVLMGFTNPIISRAFCEDRKDCVEMKDVLDSTIYLVDLPKPIFGSAANVIYMWIKLLWMNVMQQRRVQREWNQDRPIFFMCDEYQDIIAASKTGVSDLNFWDKSRSSGAIGIISMQHISSLYSAIGNKEVANTIMANFRQKVCFRTEDETTLDYFNKMLGRVERKRKMVSKSETQSRETSQGENVSYQFYHQDVLDAQLMRSMSDNYALAMLNMNGSAADDIINMQSFFMPKGYEAPQPPPMEVIQFNPEQQKAWDRACAEMKDIINQFETDKAQFSADRAELNENAELLNQEMSKNGWDLNKPPRIKSPAYRKFETNVAAFNIRKTRVLEVQKQLDQRETQIRQKLEERQKVLLVCGIGIIPEEIRDSVGTY